MDYFVFSFSHIISGAHSYTCFRVHRRFPLVNLVKTVVWMRSHVNAKKQMKLREHLHPFWAVTIRVSSCISLQWTDLLRLKAGKSEQCCFPSSTIIRFWLCRMSNTILSTSTKYPVTLVSAFPPLNLVLLWAPGGPQCLQTCWILLSQTCSSSRGSIADW